jgi:hypothetical protein
LVSIKINFKKFFMFSQTKKVGKALLYLLVVSGVGIFSGCSHGNRQESSKYGTPQKKPQAWHILGDYARTIREAKPRSDGLKHVDTPALIKKLKELHVTTYYYLVHSAKADWGDLRKEFMPAAQKSGINVYVYLVPPSEGGPEDPYPYGPDYVKWAKVIAKLSLDYSHLKGWVMDDFQNNLDTTFTPSYVKKMQQAAHNINPKLAFWPIVYDYDGTAASPAFHQKYGSYVAGIIFPYLGFYPFLKTYTLKPLEDQLNQITKVWPSQKVVLMVYATKYSAALYPPTKSGVVGALKIGLNYKKHGKLAGVTTYNLHKEPHKTPCNLTHFLQFSVAAADTTMKARTYAQASQKVGVDPKASNYHITFRQEDFYGRHRTGLAHHIKQFLVDGHVVWQKDVASGASNKPMKVSFDLTKYLQGKSNATIAFRLYEKKGVSDRKILVQFAKIQAQGFTVKNADFTSRTGWKLSSTGHELHGTLKSHECDPHRLKHMFQGVKQLYGQWWGK